MSETYEVSIDGPLGKCCCGEELADWDAYRKHVTEKHPTEVSVAIYIYPPPVPVPKFTVTVRRT